MLSPRLDLLSHCLPTLKSNSTILRGNTLIRLSVWLRSRSIENHSRGNTLIRLSVCSGHVEEQLKSILRGNTLQVCNLKAIVLPVPSLWLCHRPKGMLCLWLQIHPQTNEISPMGQTKTLRIYGSDGCFLWNFELTNCALNTKHPIRKNTLVF